MIYKNQIRLLKEYIEAPYDPKQMETIALKEAMYQIFNDIPMHELKDIFNVSKEEKTMHGDTFYEYKLEFNIANFNNTKRTVSFDFPSEQTKCSASGHFPPNNLYIPNGKQYRHICPQCGNITIISSPNITFSYDRYQ